MSITPEDLDSRFTYHAPNGGQAETYQAIRDLGLILARFITEVAPPCRETSTAVTKVEEAVMWANAAIARNGHSEAVSVGGAGALSDFKQEVVEAAADL